MKTEIEFQMSCEPSANSLETNEPTEASSSPSANDVNEKVSSKCPPIRKRAAYVYHHISNDIREELLRRVLNGESQAQAAKDLKINYSSAKSIIATFKKYGRMEKIPHHLRERKTKSSKTGVKVIISKNAVKKTCEPKTEVADSSQVLQEALSQISEKLLIHAQIQKKRELLEAQASLNSISGVFGNMNSDLLLNQYRIQQQIQLQQMQQYQQLQNFSFGINQSVANFVLSQPSYLPF